MPPRRDSAARIPARPRPSPVPPDADALLRGRPSAGPGTGLLGGLVWSEADGISPGHQAPLLGPSPDGQPAVLEEDPVVCDPARAPVDQRHLADLQEIPGAGSLPDLHSHGHDGNGLVLGVPVVLAERGEYCRLRLSEAQGAEARLVPVRGGARRAPGGTARDQAEQDPTANGQLRSSPPRHGIPIILCRRTGSAVDLVPAVRLTPPSLGASRASGARARRRGEAARAHAPTPGGGEAGMSNATDADGLIQRVPFGPYRDTVEGERFGRRAGLVPRKVSAAARPRPADGTGRFRRLVGRRPGALSAPGRYGRACARRGRPCAGRGAPGVARGAPAASRRPRSALACGPTARPSASGAKP